MEGSGIPPLAVASSDWNVHMPDADRNATLVTIPIRLV